MNQPKPTSAVSSRSGLYRTGLLLALPVLAGVASAQEAAPAPAPAAGDEIVKLSPFVIESELDNGYLASNSISGTRSATPIKDIPLNIQVFTKDLADDLLAGSQIDLERYNASLINGNGDVHSSNAIQQAYNAFLFRGFVQNWGLRDGVRNYDPIDTQGLARVEIVKGPAAPLYGLAYPGGIMNNVSKEADLRKTFTAVRLTAQSEGEYRATIDTNVAGKTALGRVAVRFNGANSETMDHRQHSEGTVRYKQINLSWQPLETTTVQFLAEDGFREKNNGLGYFSTAGVSPGSDVPLQISRPTIPWDWNWATGNMRNAQTKLYKGSITHAFTKDFYVNAYMSYSSRVNVDSNGWDCNAGGAGSGASWDVGWSSSPGWYDTGWINRNTPNERIRMTYHYRDWRNQNHAYGATAVYKFDMGSTKNVVTAGANVWGERFLTMKGTQPGNTTSFFDLPVRANIAIVTPVGPPPDYFLDVAGAWQRENNSNDYYFASYQFSALNNRLKLNAAVNRTNISLIQLPNGAATVANRTEISKTSPMIGGMFDIVEGLSVFAIHSTSLFPTTDKNDFEVQMPSVVGKSNELGLKFDVVKGLLSGTLSYYQITQTGGSQRDASAVNRNKLLWDGMTAAQRATTFPGMTRDQLPDRSGQLGDFVAGAEQKSKGFEADLVLQPNKNWQMIVSYANNSQETTEAVNTALIGQSTAGHIKQQLAMLSKYTFTDGPVKGLSLGVGLQKAGKALQDYAGPGGSARYNPSTLWLETFAIYKFKKWDIDQFVQLNVKNLTKQEEFVGWKDTGSATTISTQRYEVPTKMILSLTYGFSF